MKNLLYVLSVIFLNPLISRAGDTGGSDTGGGNICLRGNAAVLLELSTSAPALVQERGMQLRETALTRLASIDKIENLLQSEVGARVLSLLDRAEAASPQAISLLRRALANIEFFMTPYEPGRSLRASFTDAAAACGPSNTVAAIVYYQGEAIISIPLFNRLDLNSQAGIIIHEALRRIQITYAANGSDADLQRITRLIIEGTAADLDRDRFFGNLIVNLPAAARAWTNLCGQIRNDNSFGAEISGRIQQICGVDVNTTRLTAEHHRQLIALGNALSQRQQQSNDVAEISKISRTLTEVAHVVTHVGSAVFSGHTRSISDNLQRLRSSFNESILQELRALANNPETLTARNRRLFGDRAADMRREIQRRLAGI